MSSCGRSPNATGNGDVDLSVRSLKSRAAPQRNRRLRQWLSRVMSRRLPSCQSELTEQSHCRRDMLTGDLTIFAPGRELRPDDFRQGEHDVAIETKSDSTPRGVSTEELLVPDCPFCRGGESQTPEAVWSAKLVDSKVCRLSHDGNRFSPPTADISSEDREGWDVRVVPNKFPAVTPFGPGEVEHEGSSFLFPISRVCGGHEVFIESSSHIERLTENDSSLIYLTLLAYRDRIRHWRETDGVKYISIFKNCGRAAGASLRHSHSQLVATSVMPHRIQIALQRMESHRSRYGSSLGCDLLRGELAQGSRVVARADEFVAFCPFASRFPGMMRITTRDHQPHFDQFSESTLDRLASFLWRTLRWIAEAYPGKSYNYLLHTCPPAASDPGAFQWSIDLFPRLSQIAGFEWSSACQINSELPEVAAFNYREIAGQDDPRRVLALR